MRMSLYEVSRRIVAPVLTLYMEWVIGEAERRQIPTLYFLARDGHILREIGERICRERGSRIECRYLHCSRIALNIPTYCLLGERAADLLFTPSARGTLRSLMIRSGLTQEQQTEVIRAAGIAPEELSAPLNGAKLQEYRARLTGCHCFMENVMRSSREAHGPAVAYLRQERMMEQPCVAVVDSGWSCSIQHALRLLLRSSGYTGSLVGFYFGTYHLPADAEDGEALGWFFTRYRRLMNKVLFSPDLFECMLSAPQGMTLGYECRDGTCVPRLKEGPEGRVLESILLQEKGMLDGLEDCLKAPPRSARAQLAAFRRLCAFPRREEAAAYEAFTHCDDAAENYRIPLVGEELLPAIRQGGLCRRLRDRLGGREGAQLPPAVWEAGVIALMPGRLGRWTRWLGRMAFEWLRWLRIAVRKM